MLSLVGASLGFQLPQTPRASVHNGRAVMIMNAGAGAALNDDLEVLRLKARLLELQVQQAEQAAAQSLPAQTPTQAASEAAVDTAQKVLTAQPSPDSAMDAVQKMLEASGVPPQLVQEAMAVSYTHLTLPTKA